MALTQIDFEDLEEMIIKKYSLTWKINKPKTIQRIINESLVGKEMNITIKKEGRS